MSPLSFPTLLSPACHARRFQSPSVMPDIFNRLLSCQTFSIAPMSFPTSLIGNPRLFPRRGPRMKETKKKDTGFPLKTAGMTEGVRRACQKGDQAGMTEGGRAGMPEGEPAGMPERDRAGMPAESAGRHDYAFVIPDVVNRPSVIPTFPPSVIPDICNRESMGFSQTGPHE